VLARLTTDDLLWVDMVHAAASIAQVTGAYTTHRNVVTRALGVSASVDIKVRYTKHQAGDVYLLCSDGVSTQLDDDEIRECIADDDLPLAARCARLLAAADARVGADNATAVLIQS
jgi:protein phosphatase